MESTRKLYRSRKNKMLAGVCGGLGDYFGIDATLVRILWVLLTVVSIGIGGILVYLILALVIPEEPGAPNV
jgi:phage shock protein C